MKGFSGVALIDKPEGWTSHDVVGRSRRVFGTRKVGHAGTLDPMATGLLLLGVGKATRLLTYLVGLDKTYTATIRLGEATLTDDREGEVTATADPVAITRLRDAVAEEAAVPSVIAAAIAGLTGDIQQVPSQVSAIKVDGQRSYHRVRSGESVELQARPVSVHRFDVHDIWVGDQQPVIDLTVTVECSSGTYVRALARDVGEALGVGGHLTALRRTRVGPLTVDRAARVPGEAWDRKRREDTGRERRDQDAPAEPELLPVESLLSAGEIARQVMPSMVLTEAQVRDVRHGKRIGVEGERDRDTVAALAPSGELIAVVRVRDGVAKVLTGFPE